MNIYNRSQIRSWDAYTMMHEPVSSADLMERAATRAFDWLVQNRGVDSPFTCLCGFGNNGGDGLVIARLLHQRGIPVDVYLLHNAHLSPDCRLNLERLLAIGVPVKPLDDAQMVGDIPPHHTIIDALFGSGISRPLEGREARIVDEVNALPNTVISIDMPSGLPADGLAANSHVIAADITLCFQCPRFSFFLPEHEAFTGEWHILDIGLHPAFAQLERTPYTYIDRSFVGAVLPERRSRHAHKGLFGHAFICGGSNTMAGAALMAVRACLRSGAGLCTAALPETAVNALQVLAPECMYAPPAQWMHHALYTGKTAVGAGMGWTDDDFFAKLLQWLIANVPCSLVLDATALNILSRNMDWLDLRPEGAGTVLTPHPGEFARLCGKATDSTDRLERAKNLASRYRVFVVLKGAYTQVVTPGGLVYFNATGNPGMAKGGSGDVLAGLLTGLLAKGMPVSAACLLAVYLHGLAGDLAAEKYTQTAMTAMDIVQQLPEAWHMLPQPKM